MESLKPILLLVVLGGVGYGVYVALNHPPQADPSSAAAPEWNGGAGASANAGKKPDTGIIPKVPSSADAQLMSPVPGPERVPGDPSRESSPDGQQPWANAPTATSLPFGVGSMNIPATGWSAGSPANSGLTPATATLPKSMDVQARHDYESSRRAAQVLLSQGKLVEALRELSPWYGHAVLSPDEQSEVADLLGRLAGSVIYSRQPWLWPNHVVRPGESLETIAAQCQVPWQLLAKINGIENPTALSPGEELKIVRGPFHAQLNAPQQWLVLFVDGMYAGRFRVQSSGELNKPEGKYPVAKFAANHPANSLRAPFISLGGDLRLQVPADTTAAPPGTLGISRPDMDDVFDMLSERSEVTIRR